MSKTYTLHQIKMALKRAVEKHGHDYQCSAIRGMESECHCGWNKVREMAKSFKTRKKS